MKPLLTLKRRRGGRVRQGARHGRRLARVRAVPREQAPAGEPVHIGIAHAQAPETLERLSEIVRRIRPQAAIDRSAAIGPVVGRARGPGGIRARDLHRRMRSFDRSDQARRFRCRRRRPRRRISRGRDRGQGAGCRLLAELRPPVRDVGDLLEHVPFRHEDYRAASRLADLRAGEEATVLVTIDRVRVRPTRRRNLRIVEASCTTSRARGMLVWFNQGVPRKEPEARDAALGARRAALDHRRRDRRAKPRGAGRGRGEPAHPRARAGLPGERGGVVAAPSHARGREPRPRR